MDVLNSLKKWGFSVNPEIQYCEDVAGLLACYKRLQTLRPSLGYEIDGVVDNQYFVGKIPEYAYSEGLDQFGSSISMVCSTHLVPADKLGITKERM